MNGYPKYLFQLIHHLKKIPGVGHKSAEKMAFFFIYDGFESLAELKKIIHNVQNERKICQQCFALSEEQLCFVCQNETRDKSVICVVENFKDMIVFENMGHYNGLYHILEGKISIANNMTPDKLQIKSLIERIEDNPSINEIVIATSLDMEGDTTAYYIHEKLQKYPLKVSRLARGLAAGLQLEYADSVSLMNSLQNRETLS